MQTLLEALDTAPTPAPKLEAALKLRAKLFYHLKTHHTPEFNLKILE